MFLSRPVIVNRFFIPFAALILICGYTGIFATSNAYATIDIDEDGKTGLSEAIYALKASAGVETSDLIDIDGDGQTGINEAVYILKILCGIPSVPLQDTEGILASISITTIDELKEKISTKGALSLTVEISNADPGTPTEKIITLLKENNRNIEYKKLLDEGLATEMVDKLKQLNFSPVAVEQLIQLPDPDIFPMQATDDALAVLNQRKLKKLNRKLKLSGQATLGMEDFLALQTAFSQVEIVNHFGNLDQKFQNVLAVDTTQTTTLGVKAPADATPVGYALVNAVDELGQNGGIGEIPYGEDICFISRLPNLPMRIANPTDDPIDTALVRTEGSDAIVSFPETGIAVVVASRQATIVNSDGQTLTSGESTDTMTYYLPITNANRCTPYRFVGASGSYSITLVEMITPARLTNHVISDGMEYLSNGPAAELFNDNTIFNAKSYTFSTLGSQLSDLTVSFDLDYNDVTHAAFDFVLYSPSGTVYSGTETDIPERFNRESGIWRLDILPSGSISIASGQIAGLSPLAVDVFNDKTLELTTLINTDPQAQTKEFMLGTLKNVSLKTQGEEDPFDEGEVTLDLNTNMSPKLVIPSYIDDIIESGDEMNDTIALWQCWENSEKTGLEFEPDGSCFSFRAEFLRRQELYESLHTFDYQNDPETYQCRDENGDEAVCVRGELGPYNMAEPVPDDFKTRVVMNDFSDDMQRQYQDVEYLNLLSNYYDLYQNWKDRTVQVDIAQFPYDGLPYKTHEFSGCEEGDTDCLVSALEGDYPHIPVVIQTDRPIFGVPLERLKESTLPITFDYTASDQDVYDINAANWAFLSYLASQTYNAVTGNFIGMVCDSLDLVDDLHDVELAAEDDPLGSARATINRYSSSDPFYGLHSQDAFKFFMSGVPQQNDQIDTYGQKLSYAQIVCDCANLTSSGMTFAKNTDAVLNLDYEELGTVADVYKIIGGTSTAVGGALIMAEAEEIVDLIRSGDIDGARDRMKTSSSINSLNQGQDLYDDLASLLSGYTDVGSAGNGNNVLKSSARYLLGTNKKTRAEVEFERVGSVPVASISVLLDRVKIISNYEEDDEAEIRLLPFVGVISDKPRVGEELESLFTDSEDISGGDHPWNYLRFNDVADGQVLETPDTVLYAGGGYNTAALYVELAVVEDDGLSVEDDDMIGIFSQTIKLEEIFNENAEFKWTFLGGNDYELTITEYPIYNSSNQLSLENPLSEDYDRQKTHNQNRRPSALVSMTVRLTMGDISVLHPVVDTSLDVGVMGAGRDTYSMEMKAVSEIDTNGFDRIFDVFQGKAIVGSLYDDLLKATIVGYGAAPYYLTNQFTYDVNNFSGDLLPIKEAMTASRSLATGFRNADNDIVKELPMVQLLPDNRLLFAISHDEGARLMIVSYTDAGEMTLENTVFVEDVNENPVYSLLNPTLSPDRTRLLVPYVPAEYGASTDKTVPAYPKLNLYEINGDGITLLSVNSFGDGVPLTNVEFIDESHVAMLTRNLVFGSDGGTGEDPTWWPDWETVQEDCTCDDVDCLFETVGRDILLFTINDSHRLELTDSRDIFYTPSYEVYLKDFFPLRMLLSMDSTSNDLQLVSNVEGYSSVLRLGQKIYQLDFEPTTGDYYFGNSSSYQNTRTLRYNADGGYYCADGITCSGYLRSALNPSRDDTNVFKSEDKIWAFEFADTDRDLALGIYGNSLQLLSLYDGAAYKGPQITGDIFDTAISVNSSDTLEFSFTVTDRDTPLENLNVEISVITVEPSGYGETTVSQLSFAPNGAGGYDWTGSFSMGEFDNDTVLNETILVSISDGTYTSEQTVTIFHKPSILITFADSTYGVEAWKTDGTTSGTKMLNDANTEGDSTDIGSTLYKFDKNYFYTGTTDNDNYEPFIASADGQAKPLKEGISGGSYTNFMAFQGFVYFKTKSSSGDSTLWKTNGTSVGTVEVKTISNGDIAQFFNFNNGLYFFVNGNNGGKDELWKSDGTYDGTELVKDSLYYTNYASISNGKLFFSGKAYDGTQTGLWVSDGTTDGTGLLKECIQPPSHLTDVDGVLYFQNFYQITTGDTITHMDLWKTDGSVPGTVLVKEDSRPYWFFVDQAFVCDDSLYFFKKDELWKSDGTGAGTIKVNTLYDHLAYNQIIWHSVQVINNTIYFNIQFYPPLGYRIYAIHPKTNSDLIEVDPTLYDKITFYKESLNNNLIYSTQDADHYYLWAHNVDDGKTLIQTTNK